jgi:hypothetical protein
MFSEARKLHLIEEMIKLESEQDLIQIERILKIAPADENRRPSARDLIGLISKEDIELMEKAIEEGCEQINPDDWK